MIWLVDYIDPHNDETIDCIVVEADSHDDAYDIAVDELKSLKISKRHILKIEKF